MISCNKSLYVTFVIPLRCVMKLYVTYDGVFFVKLGTVMLLTSSVYVDKQNTKNYRNVTFAKNVENIKTHKNNRFDLLFSLAVQS